MYLGMLIAILTGCAAQQLEETPRIGMPNPASAYCVDQGGKLDIHNEVDGQVAYCHLPDGKVVEEWALYRSNQDICLSRLHNRLSDLLAITDKRNDAAASLSHAVHFRKLYIISGICHDTA